jgi:hypothetical protein
MSLNAAQKAFSDMNAFGLHSALSSSQDVSANRAF